MMMMRFPSQNVSFCEEIQEWVLSLEPGQAQSAGLFLLYARSTKEPFMSAFVLASQWFLRDFDLSAFSAFMQASYYVASIIL
jgi:hypothetical protein